MDKLAHYRNAIKTLINHHAQFKPHGETIERQILFDTEHDHYQLLNVGWRNVERIYYCVMHFDIKENQIWIQHNSTESDVDQELIALGVAPEDIVIAFIPIYQHQFLTKSVTNLC